MKTTFSPSVVTVKALLKLSVWIAMSAWAIEVSVRTYTGSQIAEVRNASPPSEVNTHQLLPIEWAGHDQYIR